MVNLPDGFDRDLRLLLFSMASRRVAMGFLFLVRSIYFSLLGYSPTMIGTLISLATIVGAIRQIVFGVLSDRLGRKPFILLGTIFTTARFVIFASHTNFWYLALGQVFGSLGEGSGAGQPVVSGYITDKTDEIQRSKVFNTLGITNALATTIGFALSGLPPFLQGTLDLNIIDAHAWLWRIGAALSAISILFVLYLGEIAPNRHEGGEMDSIRNGLLGVSSWGVIARFSLVRSLSGLGWGLIGSLLPLYFHIRFGVGSDVLGPVYAISRLVTMFSYLLLPKVVDAVGEVGALIWTRLISVGMALSFSIVDWFPLALGLLFVYRFITHFSMPIRQSFATSLVAPEETATAVGFSNFSRMTLRTIAPVSAGYMFEAVSLSLPFISGAGLVALNAVLYKLFYGHSEKAASTDT